MRFYDRDKDIVISQLSLFLTRDDAKRLYDVLDIINAMPKDYVATVEGEGLNGEFNKELTIRIYDEENIDTFDDKIKEVILKGPGNTRY